VIFWKASKPHPSPSNCRHPCSPELNGNNLRTLACNRSGKGIMSCGAAPSTSAAMQSPTMGHSVKCRERCAYVIVGHSDAGLLFVPATLSMSHLGSWELSLSVDRLAMGSIKPHVRRWNARPAFDHQTRSVHAAMHACNICALQIGLQGVLGPSQLTSGTV
jgi:hypothetical protein